MLQDAEKVKELKDTSGIKNKDIIMKPNILETCLLCGTFIVAFLLGLFLKNSIFIAIQGSLFSTILLYMSLIDIKYHLVSDFFILGIVAFSLITIVPMLIYKEYYASLWHLLAGIILPIPLFIASFTKSGGIGGGDIKFVAACSLLLGFDKGLYALLAGLLLSVIVQLIIINVKKLDKKETTFALIPYLSISYVIFYFL